MNDLLDKRPLMEIVTEVEATISHIGGGKGIPWLSHPFYSGVPLPRRETLPVGANPDFSIENTVDRARNAWNEMVEERDHFGAIMIVTPRPFRLHRLLEWQQKTNLANHDGAAFNELVRDVWIDCEHPHINETAWRVVWTKVANSYFYAHLHTLKELQEREMFDEPRIFYRGTNRVEEPPGLSWTTDRERAIWFAKRWSSMAGFEPRLLRCKATVDDMLGPFHQRGEDEWILIRPDSVEIEQAEEI